MSNNAGYMYCISAVVGTVVPIRLSLGWVMFTTKGYDQFHYIISFHTQKYKHLIA